MPKSVEAVLERPKRKTIIETDLKRNPADPRYSFFRPARSKSTVWKDFQVVKFNNVIENYAQCMKCFEILSYSTKSGTGSLLRHKCAKKNLKKFATKNEIQTTTTTTTSTDNINQETSNFGVVREMENGDSSMVIMDSIAEFKKSPIENVPVTCSNFVEKANEESDLKFQNYNEDINSCSRRDKYDEFGENVANELRQMRDVPDVQFQLKASILKNILEANTAAYEARKRQKTRYIDK